MQVVGDLSKVFYYLLLVLFSVASWSGGTFGRCGRVCHQYGHLVGNARRKRLGFWRHAFNHRRRRQSKVHDCWRLSIVILRFDGWSRSLPATFMVGNDVSIATGASIDFSAINALAGAGGGVGGTGGQGGVATQASTRVGYGGSRQPLVGGLSFNSQAFPLPFVPPLLPASNGLDGRSGANGSSPSRSFSGGSGGSAFRNSGNVGSGGAGGFSEDIVDGGDAGAGGDYGLFLGSFPIGSYLRSLVQSPIP